MQMTPKALIKNIYDQAFKDYHLIRKSRFRLEKYLSNFKFKDYQLSFGLYPDDNNIIVVSCYNIEREEMQKFCDYIYDEARKNEWSNLDYVLLADPIDKETTKKYYPKYLK